MNQNQLLIEPDLPEPFPDIPEFWICSKTGEKVPKRRDKNIEWRMKLIDKAENDEGFQKHILSVCSESLLFWVNAFGMTYRKWDVLDDGTRRPAENPDELMLTWTIQDELLTKLESNYLAGKDLLIDKAREMGATYCCVFFFHWLTLFRENANLGELSKNEKCVDWEGDVDGLFQKHDYINKWLPDWMRPPECFLGQANRKHLSWTNPITNSSISGESTTKHAGRSSRRDIQLLDEFGSCQNGAQIRNATRDTALMRIVNGTPVAGSEYNKWKNDKTTEVFVLPWHEHPEKGRNRYVKQVDKKFEIRSPWFDVEEKIRGPKFMASEILRMDIELGMSFFINHNVENHIALYARPPKSVWDIRFNEWFGYNTVSTIIKQPQTDFKNLYYMRETPVGPLKLWCELKNGRPDQTRSYIFGIDTSKGQGASNSVISIKCKETGEKVGEWTDANYPSYEFAQIVVALALWFGGPKPWKKPFLKWESNGPGWDLGRIIVKKYLYPYYYRAETTGKVVDRKTMSYGAHTGRESKELLLMTYDAALAHGGYVNRSKVALEEALTYIHYAGGGIGPAELTCESQYAKKTHGDRVIADALTIEDRDIPKSRTENKKPPVNSCEYRFQQVNKKLRERNKIGRRKFDFSMAVN